MNEAEARAILGHWVKSDNSLGCICCGLFWNEDGKEELVTWGWYEPTPHQQEAVGWWILTFGRK